ncbi:MAG TPA: hypothetical protein VKP30_16810 [Polyangiaceae bacterium]|nr:hypothetical protein [Polyangiaceae bacterium]
MHERRLSVESNQDGGSATSSRLPTAANERGQAEQAAVDQLDLEWGSESAELERNVRASSAVSISQQDPHSSSASPRNRSAVGSKALPPRPANFPSGAKNPPVARQAPERLTPVVEQQVPATEFHGFQSDPPGGSTRAYDRTELERLLKATDSLPSGFPGASKEAQRLADTALLEGGSTQTLPPAPPASPASSASPTQSASPLHVASPPNQISTPETDEPTTAYIRPSMSGLLETTLSLGERQQWPAQGNPPAAGSGINGSTTTVGFGGTDPRLQPLVQMVDAPPSELTGPAIARRSLMPLRARRSRWTRLVWGFAALLFCLAVITVWGQSRAVRGSAEAPSLRSAWNGLFSSKNSRVASEPTRLIQLEVVVDPPQAKLYLDGREASNPLKISYPADGAMHEFAAVAQGFQSRNYRIKFDRDVSVFFGLIPTTPPAPVNN